MPEPDIQGSFQMPSGLDPTEYAVVTSVMGKFCPLTKVITYQVFVILMETEMPRISCVENLLGERLHTKLVIELFYKK